MGEGKEEGVLGGGRPGPAKLICGMGASVWVPGAVAESSSPITQYFHYPVEENESPFHPRKRQCLSSCA